MSRAETRNLVVEDMTVGVGIKRVQILVRDLVIEPGQEIVDALRVASQRCPQLIDLVYGLIDQVIGNKMARRDTREKKGREKGETQRNREKRG